MPAVKEILSEKFTVIRGFRDGRDLDRLDTEWLGENLKKTGGTHKAFVSGSMLARGRNTRIIEQGNAMGIDMVVADIMIPKDSSLKGLVCFHFTNRDRDTVYCVELEPYSNWRDFVQKVMKKNFEKSEHFVKARAVGKTS